MKPVVVVVFAILCLIVDVFVAAGEGESVLAWAGEFSHRHCVLTSSRTRTLAVSNCALCKALMDEIAYYIDKPHEKIKLGSRLDEKNEYKAR